MIRSAPVTIQCMVEGEPTTILDTEIISTSMYDEPLPIKHIIHRKSLDSFAKMIVLMEEHQCKIIEFRDN